MSSDAVLRWLRSRNPQTIYPHVSKNSSHETAILQHFLYVFCAGMRAIVGWSAGATKNGIAGSGAFLDSHAERSIHESPPLPSADTVPFWSLISLSCLPGCAIEAQPEFFPLSQILVDAYAIVDA